MKCTKKWLIGFILLISWSYFLGAQNQGSDILDFSKSERSKVPEMCRWRLEELFKNRAEWQAAFMIAETQLKGFKVRLDGWKDIPVYMADCLKEQDALQKKWGRLSAYASLGSQTAWSDSGFQDMSSQIDRFFADFYIQSSRLDEKIMAVKDRLEAFEKTPELQNHIVYIRELFRSGNHRLSQEMEAILARMSLFTNGPKIAADCLRNLDIPAAEMRLLNGTTVVIDRTNRQKYLLSNLAVERKMAHEAAYLNRMKFENTFASLIDTRVKQDAFMASVRHYPDSLSAELFPYHVPTSVYRNLIKTVRANMGPYHRYINLRKKILGLKEYHCYDEYLPLVSGRPLRYSYDEACRLLATSTQVLGKEYSNILNEAFSNHWVDVYGYKDKMNQGSAQSFIGVHPFVNLDYRGSFFDMITVAHELGHALSFQIPAQVQPLSSSQICWFVSEVPSTFNEILVMRQLIRESQDDQQKVKLLNELIRRLILLFYDDACGAELQLAIHEKVEEGGTLTPAWLNEKQLELSRFYLGHDGGVTIVDEYMKGGWNTHTLFFSAFQDYFYLIGSLVSLAVIHQMDQDGEKTAKMYMDFLKTGGSRPITEVLREMGIDLETSQPAEFAAKVIDELVSEMEKLAEATLVKSDVLKAH